MFRLEQTSQKFYEELTELFGDYIQRHLPLIESTFGFSSSIPGNLSISVLFVVPCLDRIKGRRISQYTQKTNNKININFVMDISDILPHYIVPYLFYNSSIEILYLFSMVFFALGGYTSRVFSWFFL